ncbi:nucleotidyltransferase domain-containing protein [Candidatus Woesearchaeota archaeon]|nr:nucleotidyltransferase domain-containing protein [Candidatus Woesearchaeota archaeon]
MIHNKYFGILKHYLGNYKKETYGRELLKTSRSSQKNIALTLQDLQKKGVLQSRSSGTLKYYHLNLANPQIKDFLLITELLQKIEFAARHPKIAHIFKQDTRIVGIFGSYAKGTEKKDSDIDLFIVGNKRTIDYDKEGAAFDLNISIKYFSEKQFQQLIVKNPLTNEIFENHVLIFGGERFIDIVWKNKYGLD